RGRSRGACGCRRSLPRSTRRRSQPRYRLVHAPRGSRREGERQRRISRSRSVGVSWLSNFRRYVERRPQPRKTVRIDRARQLLAFALRVDQARVSEFFDVVGYGRGAELEAAEQLDEETVVRAALREVESRVLEQVHEQA